MAKDYESAEVFRTEAEAEAHVKDMAEGTKRSRTRIYHVTGRTGERFVATTAPLLAVGAAALHMELLSVRRLKTPPTEREIEQAVDRDLAELPAEQRAALLRRLQTKYGKGKG